MKNALPLLVILVLAACALWIWQPNILKTSANKATVVKTTPASEVLTPHHSEQQPAIAAVAKPTPAYQVVVLSGPPVQIATNGVPQTQIVLVNDPSPIEKRAAEELATYLHKITGGTFPVIEESAYTSGNSIQVGNTAKARANGLDCTKFASQHWKVKAADGDIFLNGGRPVGTLYAAYHFLEDQCGVRWWRDESQTTIPPDANLRIAATETSGKPAIPVREIYWGDPYTLIHNRLNVFRGGPAVPGDDVAYYAYAWADGIAGNNVHCNATYINPDTYFASHPEWFSANESGMRQNNGQLCLTNPGMRKQYLSNLLANIDRCKQESAKAGRPAPTFYDVSQNDNERYCHCADCSAIAKAEGAQSGPIVDFVNWLADGVKAKHPEVILSFLAYMYSEEPPASLKPHSNVAVRLCDTVSNFLVPITQPDNAVFKKKFDGWSAIASPAGIHMWKYIMTYSLFGSAPLPNLRPMQEDFQYYTDHNVQVIFCEHESINTPDMWEYKNWMLCKMMENPNADFDRLQADYCHGYFGAAGDKIIEYRNLLDRRAADTKSHSDWQTAPEKLAYLDQTFFDQAQAIFDAAVTAVANDPVSLSRVNQARILLDRTQVYLIGAGVVKGDKAAIAARYRDAWRDRIGPGALGEIFKVDADCDKLTQTATYIPAPTGIPGVAPQDIVLDQHAAAALEAEVIKDREAPSGYCLKWVVSEMDNSKYQMPMPFGIYSKKGQIEASIPMSDIPGPGYNWYKVGSSKLYPDSYVWATWPWVRQIQVGGLLDPANPDQIFDVWVSLKFEGPKFGVGNKPNAVYIERTALVKRSAPAPGDAPPAVERKE